MLRRASPASARRSCQTLAVMNVFVARNPGWYGKLVPLDLLCNGKRLASIQEKKSIHVQLESGDLPATLEVRMQEAVGSPVLTISRLSSDLYLECGANKWTFVDFFGLYLLPGPKNKVFYFRKVVPS